MAKTIFEEIGGKFEQQVDCGEGNHLRIAGWRLKNAALFKFPTKKLYFYILTWSAHHSLFLFGEMSI